MERTITIYNKDKTKCIKVSKEINNLPNIKSKLQRAVNELDWTIKRKQEEMNKRLECTQDIIDELEVEINNFEKNYLFTYFLWAIFWVCLSILFILL